MTVEIRSALALEIARYFHRHLLEELRKPDALLDRPGVEGPTPRETDRQVLADLVDEFPALPALPQAPFNLIAEWVRRNRFIYRYDEYAFDLYNRVFLARLLALHRPTPARLQAFKAVTLRVFGNIDIRREGFSISFFLRVENNMRELLRDISRELPGIDHDEAWRILYEQSSDYHEFVNEVFERRLTDALAESDRLLHNILPAQVADELKKRKHVAPTSIASATVLFSDFVGFTSLAERMPADDLIRALDDKFSRFDRIVDAHGLEKIKTIGDAYMCAGGVPTPSRTHAVDVALAALEMRASVREPGPSDGLWRCEARIGFHTGPLVAGVIGHKKFSYDIWGDTVNTASRMESSGAAGRINTSEPSFRLLEPLFVFTPRGDVEAKGKGKLPMYFLEGIRPELSEGGDGITPNDRFRALLDALRRGDP